MKNILIGLGAKAQVGKDYAVIKLQEMYNYDIERIAFADALKHDLSVLFEANGFNLSDFLSNPDTKKLVRPLLVEYGQTMRKFNPNVWIDRALSNRKFTHDVTIVTDVRFPNEVKRLKELGGYYIHIDAEVPPANETEAYYEPQMLILADFVIRNSFNDHYVDSMAALISNLRNPGFSQAAEDSN